MIGKKRLIYLLFVLILIGCKRSETSAATPYNPPLTKVSLTIDKARYNPGDVVHFTVNKDLPSTAKIRYRHMNEVIKEENFSGKSWQWTVPGNDFTGYMVDIYETVAGKEVVLGSIGVDVSSEWSRFPRYGFLSRYSQMSNSAVDDVVKNLNRDHINGIQFYDCEYEHHLPLAGTTENPDTVWTDIAGRDIYMSTLKKYLNAVHSYNMTAMLYNLAYGALSDAKADGVSDQWYLYTDRSHGIKDKFVLPNPPFKSNIWLLDPSNTGWQQYIANKTKDFFKVFDFDGYHIDQLGNRDKNLYTYNGASVNLPTTFEPFIQAMHVAMPGKRLVMNAVNQYGQRGIANSPVDFLYTEVWAPNNTYADLASIIRDNLSWSNGKKNSVLAAYMDSNLTSSKGFFNTPGVLLTDAVIFAFGGAHIELGEHMLSQPYFPNNNLQIRGDLRDALVKYYDFLVAYENLLRDGGVFNNPDISSLDNNLRLNNWPPRIGSVAVIGKETGNGQVIHLLNFSDATTLNWRDASGTQPYPHVIKNWQLQIGTTKAVKKVWYASPDYQYGSSVSLPFTQSGATLTFTLPEMQYWGMIVLEYE